MIGRYRIYPAWFRCDVMSAQAPMHELAMGAARRMNRHLQDIKIIGTASNWRGDYVDFDVTFSNVREGNNGDAGSRL